MLKILRLAVLVSAVLVCGLAAAIEQPLTEQQKPHAGAPNVAGAKDRHDPAQALPPEMEQYWRWHRDATMHRWLSFRPASI
jgi:hypothetical protein